MPPGCQSRRRAAGRGHGIMTGDKTVLVVGGGPAGSTAAALIARAGYRVRLFEREAFPRYHIGESLAPSCRAVLELSGAEPTVAGHGFQIKRGGLFRWGDEDWSVDWSKTFGQAVYSWQVERSDFDRLLLENARKQGVDVIEGATVKRVLFEGSRTTGIDWARPGETTTTATYGDFIVDASGRGGILSTRHFKNRAPHKVFRNVAIWGYWQGGETLPGTPEGGINAISSPDGWYWVIPLGGETFSVGFVTHRDNFLARRPAYATLDEMLLAFVEESSTVRALVGTGKFEPPVRVEQDYSYAADRFCGPGHVLLGDAACFLDPLLSTGTHLAMYSALLGAAAITATLDGTVSEEEALEFFEHRYRHSYHRFLKLVSLMYQQYRGKETYFWLAQRLVQDGVRYHVPFGPFTKIISGLSDLQDAGYSPSWAAMKRSPASDVGTDAQRHNPAGHPDGTAIAAVHDPGTRLRLLTRPRIGLERIIPGNAA